MAPPDDRASAWQLDVRRVRLRAPRRPAGRGVSVRGPPAPRWVVGPARAPGAADAGDRDPDHCGARAQRRTRAPA